MFTKNLAFANNSLDISQISTYLIHISDFHNRYYYYLFIKKKGTEKEKPNDLPKVTQPANQCVTRTLNHCRDIKTTKTYLKCKALSLGRLLF